MSDDDNVFSMLRTSPTSVSVMVFCTLIWAYLWNFRVDFKKFSFNYDLITRDGQYWRCITAAFAHTDVMHLGFNMFSIAQLGGLENALGSLEYFKASILILLMAKAMLVVSYYVLLRFAHWESVREVYALGYSGVVFGLFAVSSWINPNVAFFFVPGVFAPFFGLFLTQLMIPTASFAGHLCGILAGYLYAFGLFAWLDPLTMAYSIFWLLVLFVGSVKQTTSFPLPFIHLVDGDEPAALRVRSARLVNGQIVYDEPSGSRANNNNNGGGGRRDRLAAHDQRANGANGANGAHDHGDAVPEHIVDISHLVHPPAASVDPPPPAAAPSAADRGGGRAREGVA